MKDFEPTYLYVKTHNVTGLKYFGKTKNDPFTYNGSGKYWLSHLKVHGYNYKTEIIGYFTNKDDCVRAALQFSIDNDIVKGVDKNNKKVWANQITENGLDGGKTKSGPLSEETKRKIGISQKGKIISEETKEKIRAARKLQDITHLKNREITPEWREKISNTLSGTTQSEETRKRRSDSLMGHVVTEETRDKIRKKHIGKILSEETKEKLRNRIISEETKEKIRAARKNQIITDETRRKLSGRLIVVDKQGNRTKINKDIYYAQTGPKEEWEWLFHKCAEAKMRR